MKLKRLVSAMIAVTLLTVNAAAEKIVLAPKWNEAYNFGVLYGRGIQIQNEESPYYGNIYVTSEYYKHGDEHFPIYESTDEGDTFELVGKVYETENNAKKYKQEGDKWIVVEEGSEGATSNYNEGWRMLFEPFLFEMPETVGVLKKGDVICSGAIVAANHCKIDVYVSRDGLRTWEFSSSVAEGGKEQTGIGSAIWEPFMFYENGALYCFFSDERGMNRGGQRLVFSKTTDGVNWSEVVKVADFEEEHPHYRPGMPAVVKMNNGKFAMVYEGVNMSNPLATFYKVTDDIENWNYTEPGEILPEPFVLGSPYMCLLKDGRVAVGSSGTTKIAVNSDNLETNTWEAIETGVAAAYSRSLFPMNDGRILVVSGETREDPSPHKLIVGVVDPENNLKITPVAVEGTTPWHEAGTDITTLTNDCHKVFDSDTNTFFDGFPDGRIIIDLGKPYPIGGISYTPRKGLSQRMRGSIFYGSNDKENWQVIYSLAIVPFDGTMPAVFQRSFNKELTTSEFRYIKYTGNGEYNCNIAEIDILNGAKTLYVDGKAVGETTMHRGEVYVPVRALFEALGYKVTWNGATNSVTAEKDGEAIELTIGDFASGVTISANGNCVVSESVLKTYGEFEYRVR